MRTICMCPRKPIYHVFVIADGILRDEPSHVRYEYPVKALAPES